MNIEHDRYLYVYTHSAQRARELLGFPPDTEVRLSEEQIEGALPQWAVKVPPLQPTKEPHWSDKGKIRLECTLCGEQHDGVAAVPPAWTDVEEVRSFERATADVPDVRGVNEYGDTVWNWQTHLGVCPECREECRTEATETKKAIDAYRKANYIPSPDCREECRQEVKEAAISSAIQPLKELLDKLGDLPGIGKVDLPQPPQPVASPNRYELSNKQLAVIAKGLLMDNGGFTLDEYGNPATGDFWAVFVAGKECAISGRPSIDELKAYLDHYPPEAAFFGGWEERDERGNVITYLDHTLLFAHKHTAVAEGLRNRQKAIYNLKTEETLELAEFGPSNP